MSSRAEVLKALPVSLTQDSPDAQVAWDAIFCGQDVSVEGSKALWPEAIVLPALCKWKASRHGGLLVIAERSVCDLLAEMPALFSTTLLEMSSNQFGYLLLTPEEITKEKLQILGPEGGSVILVILHSKEQSTSSLRSSLQLLSAPSQVIIAVESWEESTRQLATEILGTAVAVSLDGKPEKVSEKENKIEKEDEDAHLVAGFMANIISRSEDQDFRAACRALIKAGTADVDTMPTQGTSSVDEMEDAEFRQGIAALMARHHVATRSKQSKPAGKSKGKKRVAEPSPEAKRLAADWDDCSDSFDFGF